jgi:hypothetical protein
MTKVALRAWPFLVLICSALAAPLACGSSDSGSGGGAGGTSGSASGGAAVGGSGGLTLNVAGSSSAPIGAGGDCGDTQTDSDNCGACGTACGAGQACVAGACVCPAYQSFCGGACIPTSVDPNNCGACGVACTGAQACSAGACAAGCLPGLTVCSNACVDLQNDNANCGACGSACGAKKGCADGRCVDTVTVGADPKTCVGGGAPISVGTGALGCLGTLAQTTFRWSLCSCTDLNVSAALTTDAYDSTTGPYKAGELGGGVGVDRDVTNWSEAVTVGGTLWVSGTGNYSSSGPPSDVKADLHLGGSWKASTKFTVEGPAYVGGTLSGVTVAGKTEPVMSVAPACDCSATELVPVTAIVQAHASPNNDNAAIGLDETVFEKPGAPLRLDLPCGNFYFTSIQPSLALSIHVHGRTAIYVAGDVSASSPLAFTLEPDAELDVFVGGTLKTSDTFVFGSPNYPALSRMYVAGADKIALSADVRLGGEFYAANSAEVDWSAKNAIYGSVFAGNFRASDVTDIHYDRGVLRAGDKCPPGGGGSGGGPGCGSCEDCHNQACKDGVCGACTSDSDCCSPLICTDGTCVAQTVVK